MTGRRATPLVLLGPPGAGKGTQAEFLSSRLAIPHISTGSILREEVRKGSPLGVEAKSFMDRGQLAPDELMLGIVRQRLQREDCTDGFLCDGFPRSVPQAEGLERVCAERGWVPLVISLNVPVDDVIQRLSGRRTCAACGASFHLSFDPPTHPAACDRCGGKLLQRDDDREEVIKARLEVYRSETEPLVQFYDQRGALVHVDGTGSAREVADRVATSVDRNLTAPSR